MTKKVLSLVFVCLSITKLSAAMIYDTGSLVGIGTDSPEQNLHIHDYNGSAQLRLERTGRSAGHIDVGADEQGFHIFDDSFQKVFTVKKDGKLGVGTTAPYRPGHFVQNGGSAQLRLERRGNSEGYMDIGADNQGFHVFHDGSTYLTTVSPDGDYGIGTKQPKSALHVKSGRNRVVTVEGEFPDSHSYSYMSFKNNSSEQWRIFGYGSSHSQPNSFSIYNQQLGQHAIFMHGDGQVAIGSDTIFEEEGEKATLSVGGLLAVESLKVRETVAFNDIILQPSAWADDVFDESYELMPIEALKSSISAHKHLPGIPSEKEVLSNGVSVSDMQANLLRKVEELTLYIIELKEENISQENEIRLLKAQQAVVAAR